MSQHTFVISNGTLERRRPGTLATPGPPLYQLSAALAGAGNDQIATSDSNPLILMSGFDSTWVDDSQPSSDEEGGTYDFQSQPSDEGNNAADCRPQDVRPSQERDHARNTPELGVVSHTSSCNQQAPHSNNGDGQHARSCFEDAEIRAASRPKQLEDKFCPKCKKDRSPNWFISLHSLNLTWTKTCLACRKCDDIYTNVSISEDYLPRVKAILEETSPALAQRLRSTIQRSGIGAKYEFTEDDLSTVKAVTHAMLAGKRPSGDLRVDFQRKTASARAESRQRRSNTGSGSRLHDDSRPRRRRARARVDAQPADTNYHNESEAPSDPSMPARKDQQHIVQNGGNSQAPLSPDSLQMPHDLGEPSPQHASAQEKIQGLLDALEDALEDALASVGNIDSSDRSQQNQWEEVTIRVSGAVELVMAYLAVRQPGTYTSERPSASLGGSTLAQLLFDIHGLRETLKLQDEASSREVLDLLETVPGKLTGVVNQRCQLLSKTARFRSLFS